MEIKKTELRMPTELYEKIYQQVFIEKKFKSLNEAYVYALTKEFDK